MTPHEPERAAGDIDGRRLTFNGVAYTALPRSRRLKAVDVYPLRHQQRELVLFEVKIFQCDAAAGAPVVEMPRVPVAALPYPSSGDGSSRAGASILEVMDITPILTTLAGLARRPECHAEVGTIHAVIAAYEQLAAL